MTQFLAWLPWIGLAAAMVAVWVGTSYFWLRLARVPAAAAFAAAPAATAGLILPISILYETLGWFWSGARVFPVLVVIGAVGAGFFLTRSRVISVGRPRYRTRFWSVGFVGAAAVGWLLAALPTMVVAPPSNPVQQWDPSFHLNGVWGMTHLGIGATGNGLAHNYGGETNYGYPIGWHAFTSLFATPETTVQTANASSLALMAVWVVGAAVYTYTLYPSRRAALAAAVIAGLLPSMPADALTAYSQWPNAMSVALLPGGATVVVLLGRSLIGVLRVPSSAGDVRSVLPLRSESRSTLGSLLVVSLLAILGGIQAHQVYAFNLLFLLLPALLAGAWRLIACGVRQRRPGLILGTVASAVFGVVAFVWVQLTPEVESMRNYPRYGVDISRGISQALVPNPPFNLTFGLMAFNVVISALLVAGILRVMLGRYRRAAWVPWPGGLKPVAWPVWSYLLFATFVFFAYGPDWPIRKWIVGPWFVDGRRVMEAMSLALVPLVAIGFGWLAVWCVNWWNMSMARGSAAQERWISVALGGVLVVASGVGAMDARIGAARSVLDASSLGRSGMANQGVLDMMATLPDLLPEDAVVLGDPQAGAMYSQVIGQRWAYFPQLSLMNSDAETQEMITENFDRINEDPQVCEAVRAAGITHFISNPDGAYYGTMRSDRMPGLYGVDTSEGFELVAEGGGARLYKITACD